MSNIVTALAPRYELAGDLARDWALALRRGPDELARTTKALVLREALTFTPLEMAVFCKEVVSHHEDAASAASALTIFGNHFAARLEQGG